MSDQDGKTPQERANEILLRVAEADEEDRLAILEELLNQLPPDERMLISPYIAAIRLTMPSDKQQKWERPALFIFGAFFVVALTIGLFLVPTLTEDQRKIFRLILALVAGIFGIFIPGHLRMEIKGPGWFIRGMSAAVFFLVAYFFNPAT